ncbi:SusC/RagA family TonB-linked outer membrane protein [Rufibacter sediminis]|uniref:TonB-dependent receptor n=1 Tax=Rufibacter sediminis TaxID=2762756 RepID=A0ABR6VPM2_9BACT|nr:TonB-dependent receptor [Rufibacter sediminis]MBC3539128.1 TonB-dependent receptor [Rufibacter sediminis]
MVKPFSKSNLLIPVLLMLGLQVSAQPMASLRRSAPSNLGVSEQRIVSLSKVLKELGDYYKVNFNYDSELFSKIKAEERLLKPISGNVIQDIERVLKPYNLKAEKVDKNTYVVIPIVPQASAPTSFQSKRDQTRVDITVTGEVKDAKGEGLPGVSVVLKGVAGIGVSTDVNGRYSINVPTGQENGVLVFSYIGFKPQEAPINNRATINITLQEDGQALEEVVVVGYGTQRRVSVVGAVDQVSSAVIEGRPAMNTTQALQGASPNLIIQQTSYEPGQSPNINIRGINTINGNSPLVVIDGIIGGDINLLNPQDIESVSILKDAGSAAIYGSRAANGVLLITTKGGKKNTRPTLSYNALVGIQEPRVLYKPVKGYENALLRSQAAVNAGLPPIYGPDDIRRIQEEGDNEWFLNSILKNALQQNHNLSISGGGENSTYLVSAGVSDQRSNLVGPNYGHTRYNYRVNLANEYGRLKLTSNLAYTRSEIKDHSNSTQFLIVDAGRVPTYYRLKDDQGRYLTNDVLSEYNPLGVLEQGGFRKYENDNILGNINAEFKVTDFLKIRGVFGGSVFSNNQFARTMQVDYFPGGTYGANRNTNDETSRHIALNTQLITEFNKTFNQDHITNVLVGVSNENETNRSVGLFRTLTDPELGTPTTETVISTGSYNSHERLAETSLNSVFGRASYSFRDKYFGEFNFRFDGSSKFHKSNRWGFFPSISAGYRISEENFFSGYRDKVGDLKVRGSYGILGNQAIGNYEYLNTLYTFQNAYGFNNRGVGGTGFTFANRDVRWESGATFNVGIDAGFLNNALTVSLDYFDRVTRDMLVPPVIPGIFGANIPNYNAGKFKNQGWEINVNYRLTHSIFEHSFSFNLGDTKNKVLFIEGGQDLYRADEMQRVRRNGLPYNSYVGFLRDGYFQNLEEIERGPRPAGLNLSPGDNRYVDANGDNVIDDNDLFVLGNPFPRYTFGATYNLRVKGFDLSLFFQGVGKRSTFIRGELVEPFHFNYSQVMYQHQLDFWTPQNPNARYPRLAAAGSQSIENNFRRGSDMYLYDASYARLKNVQIGYTLPPSLIGKIGMKSMRAYFSGQNLFTLSKLKFIDPEVTEFNSNLLNSGANSGRAYPTPVYYGFGLDVTF